MEVRVSLLDERGGPLPGVELRDDVPALVASSEIEPSQPPAARALDQRLAMAGASVADLRLAVRLAAGREDRRREVLWAERAAAENPEDPWASLALAQSLFLENGGAAAGTRATR